MGAMARRKKGSRGMTDVGATLDALATPPKGLIAGVLRAGGEEYALLSFEIPPLSSPPGLTPAEADILARIARGESNQDIATARQTSTATVANQIGSLGRKLGASCRWDLVAKALGRTPAH